MGQDDEWRHMGKICPKKSPKRGVNRHFQAKTPKSIHRNISGTINPTNKRFEDRETSSVVRHYPKANTIGWPPPSLKSICRHISAGNVPIWTKFGSRMQNNTPSTAKWSISKPEVEFQYGGRLFFQTKSSYISAVNWDMSTKFGMLIDFDLLKALTSTNTKPEVAFSGRGRHLEKSIWRHISTVGGPIWMKFGTLMQNSMPII